MRDFPILRIHPGRVEVLGTFADMQAAFFSPDPKAVARIERATTEGALGIVAHFYMDPELQSVLHAVKSPRVHIADSLAMASAAIRMAEAGAQTIAILGVDFMAENVRALLDRGGFEHIPVLRLSREPIGCTLAEAADAPAYDAFLDTAAAAPSAAHVIYVNTSLQAKARAAAKLATVTCTSSNVVRTLVELGIRRPEARLFFGPDAYMGANIATLLEALGQDDNNDALQTLHPQLSAALARDLAARFSYFTQGVCVVHHAFGADVAERIASDYADAHVTAHFEVPGEMFRLAQRAAQQGRGVVGSTSHILNYITDAATRSSSRRFILGTETGMATAIIHSLKEALPPNAAPIDLIFPVATEAVTPSAALTSGTAALPLLPGARASEGCSTGGGCATCPFMKMNRLETLLSLAECAIAGTLTRASLSPFEGYEARYPASTLDLGPGIQSMVEMQHFQATGHFSETFLAHVHRPK